MDISQGARDRVLRKYVRVRRELPRASISVVATRISEGTDYSQFIIKNILREDSDAIVSDDDTHALYEEHNRRKDRLKTAAKKTPAKFTSAWIDCALPPDVRRDLLSQTPPTIAEPPDDMILHDYGS